MEQVIYGDVYFILNFSMDFLAVYICGKILKYRMRLFSLIFASSLGALYALISLFCMSESILTLLTSVGVAALMCYITYNFKGIRGFLISLSLFYSINFLISGGIVALYSLVNSWRSSQGIYINGNVSTLYSEIPAAWIFILATMSVFFSFIWSTCIKKSATVRDAAITITLHGKSVNFRALCDSGNLLCEPISGRPVIIARDYAVAPLLSEEFMIAAAASPITIPQSEQEHKIVRLIPSQGIGGRSLMLGFIPDHAFINNCEREICVAVDTSGVVSFAGFESLVSPTLT